MVTWDDSCGDVRYPDEEDHEEEASDRYEEAAAIEANIKRLSGTLPTSGSAAGRGGGRRSSARHSTLRPSMNADGSWPRARFPTTLAPSYNGRNSLWLFSESYAVPPSFSFDLSTQENYGSEDRGAGAFRGRFKEIRAGLDFDYHGNYDAGRQAFQDRIVEKFLGRPEVVDSRTGVVSRTPTEPWVVFTAGTMGAGKGYAMKQLSSKGLFPWKSFIVVDPDEIRSHFTEYHLYAKHFPEEAGNRTHREAGYIAEIVTGAAMEEGYNVLVDGSLWDYEWYQEYFKYLRFRHPALRIAILHITAPREAVFERAARRAEETGRVVPLETLEDSLRQVPISVKILSPMADFFAELDNSSGVVSLATEGVTWDSFRDNWAQTAKLDRMKLSDFANTKSLMGIMASSFVRREGSCGGEDSGTDEESEESSDEARRKEDMEESIAIENNISRLSGLSRGSKRHSTVHPDGSWPRARFPTVLPPSYNGRNSLWLFSESYTIPPFFSFELSTQENYGSEDRDFYGPFKEIRSNLDFDYHGNYQIARQCFQDRIIMKLMDKPEVVDSVTGAVSKTPTEPWIVFTAGTMGAGKGYAMKQLSSKGLFPWKSFIVTDPDEIRSHFHEYHLYAEHFPQEAGNRTHREAGYIAEIITEAAMKEGYNVLVDGSLWDYEWYQDYFSSLREKYPKLRIAILHITAPREAVFARAAHRAKETGRVVPVETLENSLRQVPISVKILSPMADFFAELDNSSGEVSLATEGVTWDSFRDNWAQRCLAFSEKKVDKPQSLLGKSILDDMSALETLSEGEEGEDEEEGSLDANQRQASIESINIENNIARLSGAVLKGATRGSRGTRHSTVHPDGSWPKAKHPTVLPPSYNGRNSLWLFSESYTIPTYFSFDLSTQENYGSEDQNFYGPFKKTRCNLDFDYHGNYEVIRQSFQDRIVMKLFDKPEVIDSKTGIVFKKPTEPWIVFTAGTMGAGKGYAMKQLSSKGLFPWKSFVIVDPDEIRSHFTEYHLYAKFIPKEAGNRTHREAGYISEIATEEALRKGYNVLVDGSLRDYEWYQDYFKTLREKYPVLRIAILHITAPREAVFARAAHRAKETGRVVPVETLENSLRQVPISVKKLSPMADFFAELDNSSGEVSLATEGITWDSFRDNWAQTGKM